MGDTHRPDATFRDRRYDRDNGGGQYESRFDHYDRRPQNDYYERDGASHRADTSGRDMYTFRGAASRNERYPREEFSFRSSVPSGPRFPAAEERDRPFRPRDDGRRDRCYGNYDQRMRAPTAKRGNRAHTGRAGRGGRGGFVPRPAHTRDLLKNSRRSSTPEQLSGMNADGHARFISLDTSDEGSESGEVGGAEQESSDDSDDDSRHKRARTSESALQAVNLEIPKWSNPDVYTSLPPPEASGGPKKDIVKLIRKAKVDSKRTTDASNAVADNMDFISFNADDSMNEDSSEPTALDSESDYTPPSDPHDIPSAQIEVHIGHDGLGPPPGPPPGLVMPTDEELMANYVREGGSRKRKREDTSTDVRSITKEWEPNGTNPTPWFTAERFPTASAGMRLHKEICDFLEFVHPHDHEEILRRDLVDRVQQAIRSQFNAKGVVVKSFGSFAAGLYLPTADMDLVAMSPSFVNGGRREFCQRKGQLHRLGHHLQSRGVVRPGTLSVVAGAKVPIIKFVDDQTGIKVDISFENDTGLVAINTFEQWKKEYPAMPALVVLVKQLLAMRNLNEVHLGGIGGFTTICLVVSMMQMMPELQSKSMDPNLHYGDLLMTFLDLYGNMFNVKKTGIMMNPPGYFDKINRPMPKQNDDRLTIIDPNNPQNDISGGSRYIDAVFLVFKSAHAAIQRRLFRLSAHGEDKQGSILSCVWGGNYTSFRDQRNRLLYLANKYSIPALPSATDVYALPTLPLPAPTGPGSTPVNTMSTGVSLLQATSSQPLLPNKPSQKTGSTTYAPPKPVANGTSLPNKPFHKADRGRHQAPTRILSNGGRTQQHSTEQAPDLSAPTRTQPRREVKRKASDLSANEARTAEFPALSKKRMKELEREDRGNAERANAFKREHPKIAGIPDKLTRQEFRKLKQKHS